jgi:long-chain acyl-CoA synthetase
VYADVIRLCKGNKLNSLETPKQFHLQLEPWTVESDILTPTMKLKRNIARKQYADKIAELYERPVISIKK